MEQCGSESRWLIPCYQLMFLHGVLASCIGIPFLCSAVRCEAACRALLNCRSHTWAQTTALQTAAKKEYPTYIHIYVLYMYISHVSEVKMFVGHTEEKRRIKNVRMGWWEYTFMLLTFCQLFVDYAHLNLSHFCQHCVWMRTTHTWWLVFRPMRLEDWGPRQHRSSHQLWQIDNRKRKSHHTLNSCT